MPNYNGNPDIAKYGKNTQFGKPDGPDPVEAQKRSIEVQKVMRSEEAKDRTIRHTLRKLACVDLSIEDVDNIDIDFLLSMLAYNGLNNMADLVAAIKLLKALSGDNKALEDVTNDIDGKQPDSKSAGAKPSLPDLILGRGHR